MKLAEKIKESAATGYILLWLLGIPIPILLITFLLRASATVRPGFTGSFQA